MKKMLYLILLGSITSNASVWIRVDYPGTPGSSCSKQKEKTIEEYVKNNLNNDMALCEFNKIDKRLSCQSKLNRSFKYYQYLYIQEEKCKKDERL